MAFTQINFIIFENVFETVLTLTKNYPAKSTIKGLAEGAHCESFRVELQICIQIVGLTKKPFSETYFFFQIFQISQFSKPTLPDLRVK